MEGGVMGTKSITVPCWVVIGVDGKPVHVSFKHLKPWKGVRHLYGATATIVEASVTIPMEAKVEQEA